MSTNDTVQISTTAAGIYDEFFVPALFSQWADKVVTAAEIRSGQTVLDVACGTGVLTLAAKQAVGDQGAVTGLDINPGMLAAASSKSKAVDWRIGDARSLDFADDVFDHVISQFGLMFFSDPTSAVAEMVRVTRPGGRITLAVWASLQDSPGYLAVVKLLGDLFGDHVSGAVEAPFSLGNKEVFQAIFTNGNVSVEINTAQGVVEFPSVEAWMHTEIRGWTLADQITDEQFDQLLSAANEKLIRFTDTTGRVKFPIGAHIATVDV